MTRGSHKVAGLQFVEQLLGAGHDVTTTSGPAGPGASPTVDLGVVTARRYTDGRIAHLCGRRQLVEYLPAWQCPGRHHGPVEISIVPADHAVDRDFVAQMVALINQVYAMAEQGLWLDGADRTTQAEVAAIVAAGELGVVRLHGRLVGAVRIQRLGANLAEFGMLVTHPEYRGRGIGRQLVAFAEDWARNQGCEWMQLELLVPQSWTHPVKEFLRDWYQRIGYRQVRTGRLDEAYPALVHRLATPSDFIIYQKSL
jgi:GNAT superfamily N-acetyltransferase